MKLNIKISGKATGVIVTGLGLGAFYITLAFSNPTLTSTQVFLKMLNFFIG